MDVFLRERRPLRQLEEFPSEEDLGEVTGEWGKINVKRHHVPLEVTRICRHVKKYSTTFTTMVLLSHSTTTSKHCDLQPVFKEVFPLQRVAFHNISLPAPSGAKPFLQRCYGRWAEEVVVWSHSSTSRRMHRLSLQEYMEGLWGSSWRLFSYFFWIISQKLKSFGWGPSTLSTTPKLRFESW